MEPGNKEIAAMVAALANRNPVPELIKRRRAVPIFSPEYDWDEAKRVRKAFYAIVRSESVELWEELVKHLDDKRYSITLCLDDGPGAFNFTVGRICRIVAEDRLILVSRIHSDPDSRDRRDVYIDVGIEDIAKWRKERAKKSLAELQIEVCEKAISTIQMNADLSDKVKSAECERIRQTISKIKETKKPQFHKLLWEGYEFFDSAMAERLREETQPQDKKP